MSINIKKNWFGAGKLEPNVYSSLKTYQVNYYTSKVSGEVKIRAVGRRVMGVMGGYWYIWYVIMDLLQSSLVERVRVECG